MKSRIVAILLAFFLGLFGVHKFYLYQNKRGLLMLLLTITGFGIFVSGLWLISDFLSLVLMGDNEFNRRFNASQASAS